ncbi:9171_t:CDS:2, partial [Funneliformis geosporum]
QLTSKIKKLKSEIVELKNNGALSFSKQTKLNQKQSKLEKLEKYVDSKTLNNADYFPYMLGGITVLVVGVVIGLLIKITAPSLPSAKILEKVLYCIYHKLNYLLDYFDYQIKIKTDNLEISTSTIQEYFLLLLSTPFLPKIIALKEMLGKIGLPNIYFALKKREELNEEISSYKEGSLSVPLSENNK